MKKLALTLAFLLIPITTNAQGYFGFNYYSNLTENFTERFEIKSDVWGGIWRSVGIPSKTEPDPTGEPYDVTYLIPYVESTVLHNYEVRACNSFGCSEPNLYGPYSFFGVVITENQITLPIRINSGGSSFKDSQGRQWLADTMFTGGTWVGTTNDPIAGTVDDFLYQNANWSWPTDMTYSLPVPNGNYTVTLHFAEIFYTEVGREVFNVLIENVKVLNNFDVFAVAGAKTAVQRSFPITIADGAVTITFEPIADAPYVSAIEVAVATPPPATWTAISNNKFRFPVTGGWIEVELLPTGEAIQRFVKQP